MGDEEEGGIEDEPVFLTWGTGGVAESFSKIQSLRRSRFESESSPGLAVFKKGNRSKLTFPD